MDSLLKVLFGLIAGAGGFAGRRGYLVRPRVYAAVATFDVIQYTSQSRRTKMEAMLTSEGMPTTLLIVGWGNQGLRAARDIMVDVGVMGKIVEINMTPDDSSDPDAPWELANDPLREDADPAKVRIKQACLMPHAFSKLIVGYQRTEERAQPNVRMHVEDKSVRLTFMSPLIDQRFQPDQS